MQSIAITGQGAFNGTLPIKSDMISESLLQSLAILERALCFDFSAILLNETLDDPVTTNIPSSWGPFIEKPSMVQNLFRVLAADIHNQQAMAIKTKAVQALQSLACVRYSLFDSIDTRFAYVTNFITEILKFL